MAPGGAFPNGRTLLTPSVEYLGHGHLSLAQFYWVIRVCRVEIDQLIEVAWAAREMAYAPYSHFSVGAALLAADGRVFSGCNVENISFGLTNCAERVAIGAAIAAGARGFAVLVVVADTGLPISPCGACRQVLAEFCVSRIILANKGGRLEFSIDQLLPRATSGILDRPS